SWRKRRSRSKRERPPAVSPTALLRLGSPGRTRPSDQAVNSRSLYQLSYRGSGRLAQPHIGHAGPGLQAPPTSGPPAQARLFIESGGEAYPTVVRFLVMALVDAARNRSPHAR